MLVLSRKVGQSIVVGDNVTITILRISASEVRVGVDAPKDVPVFRRELLPAVGTPLVKAS